MNKINNKLNEISFTINTSPYIAGIAMIILNLGSKYIDTELSPLHNIILQSNLFKKFIILTMFFVGTKDIKASIVLTLLFIIFIGNIFHEESNYTILDKKKINTIVEIHRSKIKNNKNKRMNIKKNN
jgi:hypothetical protein